MKKRDINLLQPSVKTREVLRGLTYVPFISSPPEVVKKMLELASVNDKDVLYDLGSGDGRILITAVQQFGVKKAVGVEVREDLVKNSREEIKRLGLENHITIVHGDMYKFPLHEADVVTLFLTTSANERLKPKLEKELKNGARVVSHDYEIIGWKPVKVENLGQHKIYLYIKNKIK
ncbi:class I SAM-dependent methyltransferase [Candidatus Bathyarchaeota archaeon]|nr:MAG: class I SAM-dependent methyltransferase [Candidatus Bathyarchaeota archaeon]